MGNTIDANALRASNVKFSNGALKGMKKKDVFEEGEHVVVVRKGYIATLEKDKDGSSVYDLILWQKQPNGADVNKISDYKYDFTKLSRASIVFDSDGQKARDVNLFGCRGVEVLAQNGKSDDIAISDTKDSKSSSVLVYMDKGDNLNDHTRNVEIKANGNTGYRQIGNKGYIIVTDVGVAERRKCEIHDDNGKVTTKYFAKDGTRLKESYALSTQRKTSDGYTITTFPNGKKAILDKNGKALPVGTKFKVVKDTNGKETVKIIKK
jgi:hypothetical protein